MSGVKAEGRGVGEVRGESSLREHSGRWSQRLEETQIVYCTTLHRPSHANEQTINVTILTCVVKSVQEDLEIVQLFWKITKNVLILRILLAKFVKSQQFNVIAKGKKKPQQTVLCRFLFPKSSEIGLIFVLLFKWEKA